MVRPLLLALLAALLAAPAAAKGPPEGQGCAGCHRGRSPALVAAWEGSRHAAAGVGCEACHGDDHAALVGGKAPVTAEVCGGCHGEALAAHRRSRHGLALHAGTACSRNRRRHETPAGRCLRCHEAGSTAVRVKMECARFLAQTPEMQRQGCLSCHRVETACDACHGAHTTDLAVARNPEQCGHCHMGPDHHQYEMWASSPHGIRYRAAGPQAGPACTTCHMAGGSHDVSRGITMGLFGQPYPEGRRKRERARMVEVCGRCHEPAFAARQLADADAIQRQAKALVEEAKGILEGLHAEGLLDPAPESRPPHPLFGHRLVLGPQMLYEDLSPIEAVFFRMKKFDYVTTYKGAFHQSPDYTHWYGNSFLKLDLSEIRGMAAQLRREAKLRGRLDHLEAAPTDAFARTKAALEALRRLRQAGLIDAEEYRRRRRAVLDREGL